jgi:hypothetical protein
MDHSDYRKLLEIKKAAQVATENLVRNEKHESLDDVGNYIINIKLCLITSQNEKLN